MTAEEMFRELGYKKEQSSGSIIKYRNLLSPQNFIVFYKDSVIISDGEDMTYADSDTILACAKLIEEMR